MSISMLRSCAAGGSAPLSRLRGEVGERGVSLHTRTAARHCSGSRTEHAARYASPPRLVVERHGVKLEPVIDQLVAELARHLGLELLDLLGLELDHLAGAQVDQMVVVRFRDLLVARPALAEVMALDDAGVLEQLDGAIDRGDRDVLVDLVRSAGTAPRRRDGRRNRPARARSRGAARSCACPWTRKALRCWFSARSRGPLEAPIIGLGPEAVHRGRSVIHTRSRRSTSAVAARSRPCW